MRAVTILKEEHVMILEFLDLLAAASEKMVANEKLPREFFDDAVAFARQFADKYHHHKEEEIMFRLLAQKHAGALDAELEALKQQHEVCRNYISEIAGAIDGYEAGNDTQTRTIHRNSTEYINALKAHITHENVMFFPKVGRELSTEELDSLATEYDKWAEKTGGTVTEDNRKRLANLTTLLKG